jgi:hypothetical protein
MRMGRFAEAKTSLQRALKLMPPKEGPKYDYPDRKTLVNLLEQCEQLVELDGRLEAVLGGGQFRDAEEQLTLANLCRYPKRRYATAARFYREALPNSVLPEGQLTLIRFDAAGAAILAAAGKGEDAANLEAREKAGLRQQALAWLREALKYHTKEVQSGEARRRTAVQKELQHWQKEPALASVRDKEALAELSEAERSAWQQLWSDVEVLLKKASEAIK